MIALPQSTAYASAQERLIARAQRVAALETLLAAQALLRVRGMHGAADELDRHRASILTRVGAAQEADAVVERMRG